ncbi:MAG: helix-turn-helix domain-containing protein [Polyangiaceae bacterium]
MSASHDNESHPTERAIATRWTKKIAAAGWTPIASVFLTNIGRLRPHPGARGLTPTEALTLIQIISFKWDDGLPFPAITTMADRMGRSPRQVRAAIKSLEDSGYLKRIPSAFGGANKYDLTGLYVALEALMDEQTDKAEVAA